MTPKNLGIIVAKVISVGMLLGALADHAYAYYTLLRWIVCGVAAFAAFRASETHKTGWVWGFAFTALFFNPIIPVHLNREIWAFADLGVAIFFVVSIIAVDRGRSPS